MKRPTGVTILAWLAIVGGALEILAAIFAVIALMAALAFTGAAAAAGALGGAAGLAVVSIVALVLTIWIGLLGIVAVVFGIGALGLKPWAWTLGVIWCYVAAVSDVLNIFASRGGLVGGIVGILFALAILYYLYTQDVRVAFGKADKVPPSFLVPVFAQMDKMFSSGRGPQQPQGPGSYQPPQAPGGLSGPGPQAPAHYDAPQSSESTGGRDIPAPPAPPAPPT